MIYVYLSFFWEKDTGILYQQPQQQLEMEKWYHTFLDNQLKMEKSDTSVRSYKHLQINILLIFGGGEVVYDWSGATQTLESGVHVTRVAKVT